MQMISQVMGVLLTVGVVISLQMKKKWQIFSVSLVVNLLSAVTVLLADGFNSAVLVNCLGCVQIVVTLWHDEKGFPPPVWEKLAFLALYVGAGVLGYNKPLDLLSILAAVFYMLSVFQKKEQWVRIFLLGNMASWAVYYTILKNTAVFGQFAGIASSVIALVRYGRKKSSEKE